MIHIGVRRYRTCTIWTGETVRGSEKQRTRRTKFAVFVTRPKAFGTRFRILSGHANRVDETVGDDRKYSRVPDGDCWHWLRADTRDRTTTVRPVYERDRRETRRFGRLKIFRKSRKRALRLANWSNRLMEIPEPRDVMCCTYVGSNPKNFDRPKIW